MESLAFPSKVAEYTWKKEEDIIVISITQPPNFIEMFREYIAQNDPEDLWATSGMSLQDPRCSRWMSLSTIAGAKILKELEPESAYFSFFKQIHDPYSKIPQERPLTDDELITKLTKTKQLVDEMALRNDERFAQALAAVQEAKREAEERANAPDMASAPMPWFD